MLCVHRNLEEKLDEASQALTRAESQLASLGAAAFSAAAAERDDKQLRDDVTTLREPRIKVVDQEARVLSKQVREAEFEREKQVRAHERDVKDMRNYIEKLVKLADRHCKRIKVRH